MATDGDGGGGGIGNDGSGGKIKIVRVMIITSSYLSLFPCHNWASGMLYGKQDNLSTILQYVSLLYLPKRP